MTDPTLRLLVDCPDAPGIIADVSTFIRDHRGNILDADQHSDPDEGYFAMRVVIDARDFDLDPDTFGDAWRDIADRFAMRWRLTRGDRSKTIAVFAGKATHCVSDLLWRVKSREIDAAVACVVSNHDDARTFSDPLGYPYERIEIDETTKPAVEAHLIELLEARHVDLVVLARYMQILSPAFVDRFRDRIINIHHSFLPAFQGARPYHRAFERGVKLIGATSHYVTSELDEGPIIAQATASVSHRDRVEDLIRKGRDLERVVLAQAVRLHVEDRIIVRGRKTVVLD